jgi:ABC-type transport system involved in Fe-S cluster assembly fused permease/ATPase subunit
MFRTVSERLFAHLMQLPLRFHLERQTGAVSQTLENGLQGYQMILKGCRPPPAAQKENSANLQVA